MVDHVNYQAKKTYQLNQSSIATTTNGTKGGGCIFLAS
jgi:hypothetical protein